MKTARRQSQAGVTLVEILVVLSIIAITTGAAMLRLGIGRSDDALTSAAQGLAIAVTRASDAALSTGEDRLLDMGPQGYSLHAASAAPVWTAVPDVTLALDSGPDGTVRIAADGSARPFTLSLSQRGRAVLVRFDGLIATAGQVTP